MFSYFLLVFEKRKPQSFLRKWLTHWHPLLLAPCCRGHRFLGFFLPHLLCGEHTQVYVSVCLCVHVIINLILQTEYQSFEPFEPWKLSAPRQMMMLSAHNTIFFLPRLQHIVLFRKQTFQPILFVIVHGSGRAPAVWASMRCTKRNGTKERTLLRNPDTPRRCPCN